MLTQQSNTNSAEKHYADRILRIGDLADMLAASESTIWKWAREGNLPLPIRIGGFSGWRESTIIKWLDEVQA